MSARKINLDDFLDDDFEPKPPTPVIDLPYYETLRIALEPYDPADSIDQAEKMYSSQEMISIIEQHHGVPQGIVGKEIHTWIEPSDFVRAMRYLGFKEVNSGDMQLVWIMKKRKLSFPEQQA